MRPTLRDEHIAFYYILLHASAKSTEASVTVRAVLESLQVETPPRNARGGLCVLSPADRPAAMPLWTLVRDFPVHPASQRPLLDEFNAAIKLWSASRNPVRLQSSLCNPEHLYITIVSCEGS